MNTDKTKTEKLKQDFVRQRIFLLEGIKMSDELFNKKADEFAEFMVNYFGFEIINKLSFFAPTIGDFWQFKYIDE